MSTNVCLHTMSLSNGAPNIPKCCQLSLTPEPHLIIAKSSDLRSLVGVPNCIAQIFGHHGKSISSDQRSTLNMLAHSPSNRLLWQTSKSLQRHQSSTKPICYQETNCSSSLASWRSRCSFASLIKMVSASYCLPYLATLTPPIPYLGLVHRP